MRLSRDDGLDYARGCSAGETATEKQTQPCRRKPRGSEVTAVSGPSQEAAHVKTWCVGERSKPPSKLPTSKSWGKAGGCSVVGCLGCAEPRASRAERAFDAEQIFEGVRKRPEKMLRDPPPPDETSWRSH